VPNLDSEAESDGRAGVMARPGPCVAMRHGTKGYSDSGGKGYCDSGGKGYCDSGGKGYGDPGARGMVTPGPRGMGYQGERGLGRVPRTPRRGMTCCLWERAGSGKEEGGGGKSESRFPGE